MKILVFGNVGSGKTTVTKALRADLPWKAISIDDFRQKYGDGSKEKELIARKHFFNAIHESQNQFIECIGIGQVAEELFSLIYKYREKFLCLKLTTPKEVCKARLKHRKWDIPFPQPLERVKSLIERMDEKIRKEEIEKLWGQRTNTTVLSKPSLDRNHINEIVNEIMSFVDKQ